MRFVLARLAAAGALVLAGLMVGLPQMVSASDPDTACSGTVPPGTYFSLRVPGGGQCQINGKVTVLSRIHEGPGAALSLGSAADLTVLGGIDLQSHAVFADPQNSSPVHVIGRVTVQDEAAFVLGTETPGGPVVNAIAGPVLAEDASTVQIHNTVVFGRVSLEGGGDVNPIVGPGGNFNDLEDNIVGRVTVTGYRGIWAGVLRNQIFGGLVFASNVEAVPDEYDIGSNRIFGSASCSDNSPPPNMGHSAGSPSIVYGPTLGDQASTCTGVPGGGSGPVPG